MLRYFKSPADGVPKGAVVLRDCLVVCAADVKGRSHCFKLLTAKREFVFQVGTTAHMLPTNSALVDSAHRSNAGDVCLASRPRSCSDLLYQSENAHTSHHVCKRPSTIGIGSVAAGVFKLVCR